MGKTQQAAGGGLTAEDKAKLVPGNIRQGVVLFEGTSRQVAGNYITPIQVTNFECIGVSSGGYANLHFDIKGYSHLSLAGMGNYSSEAILYLDGVSDVLKSSSDYSSAGISFSREIDITNHNTLQIYLRGNNTARINSLTIT